MHSIFPRCCLSCRVLQADKEFITFMVIFQKFRMQRKIATWNALLYKTFSMMWPFSPLTCVQNPQWFYWFPNWPWGNQEENCPTPTSRALLPWTIIHNKYIGVCDCLQNIDIHFFSKHSILSLALYLPPVGRHSSRRWNTSKIMSIKTPGFPLCVH